MTIPLFDCRMPLERARGLEPLWRSGQLASGAAVQSLEERLSKYLGGPCVVAISDMTQALVLSLKIGGVTAGDEVATLALNCLSSNSAISLAGATPLWIDVDPVTATMNVDDLTQAVTPRTKAVVVYHLAGYVGDLSALQARCKELELLLIEDANAALGAAWQGQKAGTFGSFGVFSFYANRQVNAIEGAALVCQDPSDAATARRLRRFGVDPATFRDKHGEINPAADVQSIGFSASLTNVSATLAVGGLLDLDERLSLSRANAAYLRRELSDISGIHFIEELEGASSAYWVMLVRHQAREKAMAKLKMAGVQCSGLHHRNDCYSGFGVSPRALYGTDVLEREMFALPCGWWLSSRELEHIVTVIRSTSR